MFNRAVEKNLIEWKKKRNRKPLVLRGARQTGKTTLIRKFAKHFDIFIELNLEKDSICKIFSEIRDIKEVLQSIEGIADQRIVPGRTLLFLDEIQNSMNAVKLLRYFYEEIPELHVVSAGSLLEVRMKREGWSFPVGRVEFLYLYPLTFEEFLSALGKKVLLETIKNYKIKTPFPFPLHDKLLNLLVDYMAVGGMPEAVNEYLNSGSFLKVRESQEALSSSFKEDFAKYSSHSEVEYLKLVWDRVPFEIGNRIKYSRLAPDVRSVQKAFDILHEAMLIERILPSVSTSPPLVQKPKASPKPLFLDVGLLTHALNLTRDQIKEKMLQPAFSGALFEILAGQELIALNFLNRNTLYFWIREEKGTSSELDFLLPLGNDLIPIEVKSGSQGSLKSLHQFLYRSKTNFGIRIYNGFPRLERNSVSLPNDFKIKYKLLSLPFYLIFRLKEIYETCSQ